MAIPLFHLRAADHEVVHMFVIVVEVVYETVFTLSDGFRQAPEYCNLEICVAAQAADDHHCIVLERAVQLHICQWPGRIAQGRRYGSNAGLGKQYNLIAHDHFPQIDLGHLIIVEVERIVDHQSVQVLHLEKPTKPFFHGRAVFS